MHSNKVQTIIERVKWHSQNLNTQEKDMLRDELISLLLFSNSTSQPANTIDQSFRSLTAEEKALIQKLAQQTDELYRLKKGDS